MMLSPNSLSHSLLGQLWTLCCKGDFGYVVETLALNAKTPLREKEAGRELLRRRAPFGGGRFFGLLLLLKQGGLDEYSKGGDVGDFSLSDSP